jgi:hypothetical protein|tara:strand:- start:9420 stop:11192 length:1773 start_codon:yes stop_codon:yes gene_type:complete
MKIDYDKLEPVIAAAEQGDVESIAVVREVLRPVKTDSVDLIFEKITIYNRLIFLASMKYEDSPEHKQIDRFYAEQCHSYLNYGRPRWKGAIFYGFRESAKTTRVKFGESYMTVYLKDIVDFTNVVSEDGDSSDQFNMDMFNIFAASKLSKYYPETISTDTVRKKKESQTMSKFTTTTGVTYKATSSRKSKRGAVQVEINEDGEVENKRPKKTIFDDIENETTVKSVPATQHIESVMDATLDGMDQMAGFWILLGNYLSLRGNVARMIRKYELDDDVFILKIDILDGTRKNVTWPGKYCRTDKEEKELMIQGIQRKSVESIERDSANFETEYMNNPSRSLVYFSNKVLEHIDENRLIEENGSEDVEGRSEYKHGMRDGYLEIEAPDKNETYLIFADNGKGNGGDMTAGIVVKTSGLRYKEVANFWSKWITPEDAAPYFANLGNKYNNAMVIPENNYPGNEFIAFLRPIYNNIYRIEKGVDEHGEMQFEYGVNTNIKTKPEMFLNLKALLKDALLDIRSRILYSQILEYPSDDVLKVKKKDGSGGHFDILMALAVGLSKAATISQPKQDVVTDERVAKAAADCFEEEQTNNR